MSYCKAIEGCVKFSLMISLYLGSLKIFSSLFSFAQFLILPIPLSACKIYDIGHMCVYICYIDVYLHTHT